MPATSPTGTRMVTFSLSDSPRLIMKRRHEHRPEEIDEVLRSAPVDIGGLQPSGFLTAISARK